MRCDEVEKEEEEYEGRTNSSRPIGPYEAVCNNLHYLIYSDRHRTAKVKAPPHPPVPPAIAGRKKKDTKQHGKVAWKHLKESGEYYHYFYHYPGEQRCQLKWL